MVKVRKNYFVVNFAEKIFAVDRLWTFCGRKFCGFGQKTQKPQNFLPHTFFL